MSGPLDDKAWDDSKTGPLDGDPDERDLRPGEEVLESEVPWGGGVLLGSAHISGGRIETQPNFTYNSPIALGSKYADKATDITGQAVQIVFYDDGTSSVRLEYMDGNLNLGAEWFPAHRLTHIPEG